MTRSRVLFALLALPVAVAAQQQATTSRAAELITLAREQIRANRADSALSLLKLATDSATGGAVSDREQAYVLLGVIEYIAHRDSTAAALAFRHALQLDPAVLGPSETRGVIVVHFVVGVEGAPEPESIRVTTNTAEGLTNQVLDALRAMHFRPATLNGTPVRAQVEMRFEYRAAGYNTIDYTISGP